MAISRGELGQEIRRHEEDGTHRGAAGSGHVPSALAQRLDQPVDGDPGVDDQHGRRHQAIARDHRRVLQADERRDEEVDEDAGIVLRAAARDPQPHDAHGEDELVVQREAQQGPPVGEVVPADVVAGLEAREHGRRSRDLGVHEPAPIAVIRGERETDRLTETSARLEEDLFRRLGHHEPRGDGAVRVTEDDPLTAERRDRPGRRAYREVPRHERREPEHDTAREARERSAQLHRAAAQALDDPKHDERSKQDRELACKQGEREEHPCHEPSPACGAGSAGETPQEQERHRGREAVPDEQRLVQDRRPVDRREETGDGSGRESEEALGQNERQGDGREPDQHLADQHPDQVIPRDHPQTGQDVRIERGFRERPLASLPVRPRLDRRDRPHPGRLGADGVAAQHVALPDPTRPLPVDRRIALAPRRLELGHRMVRHPPEVDDPHAGRDGDHEQQPGPDSCAPELQAPRARAAAPPRHDRRPTMR